MAAWPVAIPCGHRALWRSPPHSSRVAVLQHVPGVATIIGTSLIALSSLPTAHQAPGQASRIVNAGACCT